MHFEEAVSGNTALAEDALPGERYVATNRFKVRNNAGPKFEKRWADRKSRLAELEGFRFFALLKRVSAFGVDYAEEGDFGNYISMTVWGNKDNFDSWRTGDAFKEAHGGGGITDFIKLLSTALFILDGAPKPAFYDALIPVAGESLQFKSEGGWRQIEADGKEYLEPEVFLSQNRFAVKSGQEVAFETKWKNRESKLRDVPGFVSFFMQRRDATKADDGYNYVASTIWKDRASFEAWRGSSQFAAAHKNADAAAAAAAEPPTTTTTSSSSGPPAAALDLYEKRPQLAFYEGKLTLVSDLGI